MCLKILLSVLLFFLFHTSFSQKNKNDLSIGFLYGFGQEFKNKNYTFDNQFYKLHVGYVFKKTIKFTWELVVEPEVNFGKHKLTNPFFITSGDSDYIIKREYYSKLNGINQYILNLGLRIRKPISNVFSVFILGSIGPLISNTETERLAKGFASSNILAIGVELELNKFIFEIRPSFRHVSNAGLNSANLGFNTQNIEFGIIYNL